MNVEYEFQAQTVGGSSFDNLEQVGDRLQQALSGANAASLQAQGWELWQVNTLQSREVNGLILIYRRSKT